jgi:small neutral amino acid transporter SnatA (MarC family)
MGMARNLVDYIGITAVIILDGISIWLTYFVAGPLSRRISKTGNDILVRIGGIIVLALGFMIFTQGLRELLPGLGG